MNFEFIPGLHARAGFWVAIGAMAVIALVLFAWFRARRFLSSPTSTRRPARPRGQAPADEATAPPAAGPPRAP